MNIRALHFRPYALPFADALTTSRSSHHYRYGWLIRLHDEEGRVGWGDAAPWSGFGSSFEAVARDLERLARLDWSQHPSPDDHLDAVASLAQLADTHEARHGIELALLDLLGQAHGRAIAELLHPNPVSLVESHALLANEAQLPFARAYKVKVAAMSLEDDMRRLRAIREQLGPTARLRLDAGGGWSQEQAKDALRQLAPLNIELIEQPIAPGQPEQWVGIHRLAQEANIAIAADESVLGPDLEILLRQRSIDRVVLKPMFLGGLLAAKELGHRAQQEGLGVVVTHALESAVGRCGALHLAAGFAGIHGLGTLLAEDFCQLAPVEGFLKRPLAAGLGLALGDDALAHPIPQATTSSASIAKEDSAGVARAAAARPSPAVSTPQTGRRALPLPLETSAIAYPGRPALCMGDEVLRYCELRDAVSRRATLLREQGVAPGMRVALEGPVNAEWVQLFHAVMWLGGIVAPLDPAATAEENRRWHARVQPQHRVHSQGSLPSLNTTQQGEPERFWPLDEVRLMLCTSGSSAEPKLVAIDTLQLLTAAFGSSMRLGHLPGDSWLCCLPLHHIGGLSILLRAAFAGGCVHLQPRFEARGCNHLIDSGQIQLISLVPAMLSRLLDARADRPFPASLRAIVLGGSAAPEALLERAQRCQAPLALSYGMSETAAQIATSEPGRLEQGWLPPLLASRLVEEPTQRSGAASLPTGSAPTTSKMSHRLWVHGLQVPRGPLRTGDVGQVVQGRVRVTGRADRTIISGGKHIDPNEVSAALVEHPSVREAVVVGLADEHWGQRPHALVVPQSGALSATELSTFLRSKLSAFKVPQRFVACTALPRGALGKIRYGKVRELLEENATATDSAEHGLIEDAEVHPLAEPVLGSPGRLETLQVHKGVDELRASPQLPIVTADDAVAKGDRTLAQSLDLRQHVEAIVKPHGGDEIGLGVHQGHADSIAGDHGVDAIAAGQQRLLVSGVTHFKNPSEEQYAGSVHLKEPNRGAMYERHDDER